MNRIAGIIMAVLLIIAGVYIVGSKYGTNRERARCLDDINDAVLVALVEERKQQSEVNDALRKQADDLAAVNRGLIADLERLRDREERMREESRAKCKGTTGRELSREDAQFLTRESARADEQRAALKACYAYVDSISSK